MPRASGAPVLAVVVMGVLWGMNWPAVKFMLTEMPPLTIRAIAFPAAAVILATLAKVRGERLWPSRSEWLPIVGTGLLVIFGFNVLTTIGQMLTETSQAVIIAYTMPGMTAVLAAVFLKERIGSRQIAALLLGLAGLAILASKDIPALLSDPAGPLVMLGAAFSWALGNVALKSRRWSLPPMALTVWFFAISTVLCVALALWFEPPASQTMPSRAVLAVLVYHIIGPMVICYALWTIIVGSLPASVAAITALLAPVVGVVSAVVLLGDPFSWQKAMALVLVLTSIALALMPATAVSTTEPRASGR